MEDPLNLSTGCYFKTDDKGDYIETIIWLMRLRADICGGLPYRPMPKPVYPSGHHNGKTTQEENLNIGQRKRYASAVLLAIYQFHRAGLNEHQTAQITGIPVTTVRQIVAHPTQHQRKVWMLAHQRPIPSQQEIINQLRQEV
ncbi:hypothetical protein [Yersinia mollaretii]|uniref:hypothetical protein n=1 Tax=Yersinia mollaretii TaxID=33060 RepID=UPI0011A5CA57|nr:hypothetical protein [Yersinia mollaretii]